MADVYGRDEILAYLLKLLAENGGSVKVICIEGEPGIGKTLIADKLCNKDEVKNKYESIHLVSAYASSWERIIRTLGNSILGFEHTKGTVEEISNKIISKANKIKPILIFIDNVDDNKIILRLRGFIGKWKKVSGPVLLLTGQKFSDKISKDFCECIKLEGLKDRDAIIKLVGKKLSKLFSTNEEVWNRIDAVTGGNPQKLLYLRWLEPKTLEDFETFLDRLEEDDSQYQTETALEAIRTGLINLNVPFEHFLSIANLRHPIFSGTILSYLWDRLGGGGSEYYERSIKHLLRNGLLDIKKESNRGIKYRLNTTLHGRLQKAFKEFVTPERQAQILFFLGDYFRSRFIEKYTLFLEERKKYEGHDKKEQFPIEDLDAYIKHTIDGGYVKSAFQYLFSRGIVEWGHSAGSALGLMQILETLHAGIKEIDKQSRSYLGDEYKKHLARLNDESAKIAKDICSHKSCTIPGTLRYHLEGISNSIPEFLATEKSFQEPDIELETMAAVVLTALGRTYKDLNEHDKALECLESAKNKLEDVNLKDLINEKLHEFGLQRLKADLYHYLGIVYSVTGRAADCLEAYFEGINYAADNGCFHSRDALSLGYLAYELKFYDIDAALRMAQDSVILAKRAKDDVVLAKNLCTQGQIQSFQQNWGDATSSFTDAIKALDGKDDREDCRIKVDQTVNLIFKRNFQDAINILDYVTNRLGKTGDRRRIAMAEAYLGIIDFLTGNHKSGIDKLLNAFKKHKELSTKREAIYEALTILCFEKLISFPSVEDDFSEDKKNIPKFKDRYNEMLDFLKELNPEDYIYQRFWHKHYRTTLLINTSGEDPCL